MRALVFTLVILSGCGLAHAVRAADGVKWAALPTEADMAAVYPARASAENLGGKAVIHCDIAPDGALANCTPVSEFPEGYGFGAAAVSLSPRIRVVPTPGAPTGVNIPLRFVPPLIERAAVFKQRKAEFARLGGAGPYYPARAVREGQNGFAVLECKLAASGVLTVCKIIGEAPKDADFGYASLRMAEAKWLTAEPRLVDGVPVAEEVVRVLVPFQIGRR